MTGALNINNNNIKKKIKNSNFNNEYYNINNNTSNNSSNSSNSSNNMIKIITWLICCVLPDVLTSSNVELGIFRLGSVRNRDESGIGLLRFVVFTLSTLFFQSLAGFAVWAAIRPQFILSADGVTIQILSRRNLFKDWFFSSLWQNEIWKRRI